MSQHTFTFRALIFQETMEIKLLANMTEEALSLHNQSTLVISNSKGLYEILRDIRTSTYQICNIEEKK